MTSVVSIQWARSAAHFFGATVRMNASSAAKMPQITQFAAHATSCQV
jgi:hypothetical protein